MSESSGSVTMYVSGYLVKNLRTFLPLFAPARHRQKRLLTRASDSQRFKHRNRNLDKGEAMLPNTLSAKEVAQRTGWSVDKVRRLCKRGVLRHIDYQGASNQYDIFEESLNELLTPKNKTVQQEQKAAKRTRIDAGVERVF